MLRSRWSRRFSRELWMVGIWAGHEEEGERAYAWAR